MAGNDRGRNDEALSGRSTSARVMDVDAEPCRERAQPTQHNDREGVDSLTPGQHRHEEASGQSEAQNEPLVTSESAVSAREISPAVHHMMWSDRPGRSLE